MRTAAPLASCDLPPEPRFACSLEQEVAQYVKRNLDRAWGPTWHVVWQLQLLLLPLLSTAQLPVALMLDAAGRGLLLRLIRDARRSTLHLSACCANEQR
eukprot:scaffold635_cov535-Prasinococcus_capsulatus_cf.AAC.15